MEIDEEGDERYLGPVLGKRRASSTVDQLRRSSRLNATPQSASSTALVRRRRTLNRGTVVPRRITFEDCDDGDCEPEVEVVTVTPQGAHRARKFGVGSVVTMPKRRVYGNRPLRARKLAKYNYKPYSRIRGRGSYFSDMWDKAKGFVPRGTWAGAGGYLGGRALGAIGGPLGTRVGNMVGTTLGNRIAKLTGFGAYHVRSNTLLTDDPTKVPEGQPIAQFGDVGGGVRVRHREFVRDIALPASNPDRFSVQNLYLNPGLNSSFPWLATIAQNFQEYEIKGMIFEFKSTCTDTTNSSTQFGMGSLMMATDYDNVDANYASKVNLDNAEYSVSAKPSVDQVHVIECDPKRTVNSILYIRNSSVPTGKDPRLYDHGNFQVATQGMPSTSTGTIGELWCSYDIVFYKPQIPTTLSMAFDHFTLSSAITATNYLGANTTTVLFANAGSTFGGTCVKSTYRFPTGLPVGSIYGWHYSAQGTATGIVAQVAVTPSGGCTTINLNNKAGTPNDFLVAPQSGALSQEVVTHAGWIVITDSTLPASITITNGTIPSPTSGGDLWVSTYTGAT